MKQLRYFALIPALLLVIGAGCGKVATNTNTTAVNDAVNTNEVAVSVNYNSTDGEEIIDTSDWSSFTFDELGFSITLPFSDNQIKTHLTECDQTSGCDELGYKYSASFIKNDEPILFLSTVSEKWSPSRSIVFSDFYDLKFDNDTYFVMSSANKSYEIHPLQVFDEAVNDVVLFDVYDFYERYGENSPIQSGQQYSVAMKIKDHEIYESVMMTFSTTDVSLEEFKEIVKSIHFQ